MNNQKQTNPFYSTAAWQKLRALVIQRDRGMCVECMRLYKMGLIRRPHRAQMVHHIVPLEEAPQLAMVESNLVSLCYKHHEEKHPEKRSAETRPTNSMRIIKV